MSDYQDRDTAFATGTTVELGPGEEAEVVLTSDQVQSEVRVRTVAISDFQDSSYTLEFDGQEEYGPLPFPPTDPTDAIDTFLPELAFEDQLKATIQNLSGSASRRYDVQVNGYERPRFNSEGSL